MVFRTENPEVWQGRCTGVSIIYYLLSIISLSRIISCCGAFCKRGREIRTEVVQKLFLRGSYRRKFLSLGIINGIIKRM